MNLLELKEKENAHFAKFKANLSKEDRLLLTCKNSFTNRKIDFLKPYYYKRNKLVDQGEIGLIYCFKEYEFEPDCPISKVIALFSLSSQVEEKDYIKAKKELDKITSKNNKKLYQLLNNKYSDFLYLSIEKETGLKDGYISMITRYKSIIPNFTLGIQPALMSRSISKEIIILPNKFRYKEGTK